MVDGRTCRGFPTDFPVVGCREANGMPACAPWLPYRFPRGRLPWLGRRERTLGRGFPTDFPVVGSAQAVAAAGMRRGFPTDFPVVGLRSTHSGNTCGRGFPTDFPVVGCRLGMEHRASRGFPTDFPVVGSGTRPSLTLAPWLPYRFPRGRLRSACWRGSMRAVASLPISPW